MFNKLSKRMRNKWNMFLNKFTIDFIENKMTKEDYVEGLPNRKDTFCYWVENELNDLGNIHGATALKFGLYFGKTKNDSTKKYRFVKKYSDENDAISNIKKDLAFLIRITTNLTEFKDINALSKGMFRYKVMYLYNPKIMIPSFVSEDIAYFLEKEGITTASNSSYEKLQHQIISLMKSKYPDCHSTHDFACYLYNKHGRPIQKEDLLMNEEKDRELNKEVWSCNLKKEKIDLSKYEDLPSSPTKAKKKRVDKNDIVYYERNPKNSRIALEKSGFNCEYKTFHNSFKRKKDGCKYLELHHLVPFAFQKEFPNVSLDSPANIVALCSNCHNEIHYGENAEQLIESLYKIRKARLEKVGIKISLEKLKQLYKLVSTKLDS